MVEHALIDGDIVAHRVGFTCENDEFWVARARCDDMLDKILLDTCVKSFDVFLSDRASNNFRYDIYPLYKANRLGKPRPKHLEAIKEYLVKEWGAKFTEGMEADDYLGILQDEENATTVICSIDKDLLQIPGKHYNFVKEQWTDVNTQEALISFYTSILLGDISDNIPGAYGIGPVKARKAIEPIVFSPECVDEYCAALEKVVHSLYKDTLIKDWGKEWDLAKERAMQGQILLSARLLKIRRSFKEKLWDFQSLSQMEAFLSSSTPLVVVEHELYMEPTTQENNKDGFLVAGCPQDFTSLLPNRVS